MLEARHCFGLSGGYCCCIEHCFDSGSGGRGADGSLSNGFDGGRDDAMNLDPSKFSTFGPVYNANVSLCFSY